MKKLNFVMIMILMMFLIFVVSTQFAMAAPPWKKTTTTPTTTKPTTTTSTSPTTSPTTTQTKVIIINNTQSAAPQEAPWYKDWNFLAVAIAVVGTIGGWLISRKIRGKTAKYMTEIDKVYGSYSKNANKCEAELANLKEKIEEDFKKGKINDQALSILDARIDKYAKELRSDIVDKKVSAPKELKKNIKHMLSDGKITKEEYEHFRDILAKTQMGAKDKEEIKGLMKKWKDEDRR